MCSSFFILAAHLRWMVLYAIAKKTRVPSDAATATSAPTDVPPLISNAGGADGDGGGTEGGLRTSHGFELSAVEKMSGTSMLGFQRLEKLARSSVASGLNCSPLGLTHTPTSANPLRP